MWKGKGKRLGEEKEKGKAMGSKKEEKVKWREKKEKRNTGSNLQLCAHCSKYGKSVPVYWRIFIFI